MATSSDNGHHSDPTHTDHGIPKQAPIDFLGADQRVQSALHSLPGKRDGVEFAQRSHRLRRRATLSIRLQQFPHPILVLSGGEPLFR